MALQELWFGPAAAGSGNGSSYGNRARLIESDGTWSSTLTGFNFSTNDSLLCRLDSGNYTTVGTTLASTLFTNPPTNVCRIFFAASPGGQYWDDPDPNWNCCQPTWDTSNMVTLESGNLLLVNGTNLFINFYGIILKSSRLDGPTLQKVSLYRCLVENRGTSGTTTHRSDGILDPSSIISSVVDNSFTGRYNYTLRMEQVSRLIENVRIIGNKSATHGDRRGITGGSAGRYNPTNCCVMDHNIGIIYNTNSANGQLYVANCTIDNCTTGIQFITDSADADSAGIFLNFITNCTTAINIRRPYFIGRNRIRNYTNLLSGDFANDSFLIENFLSGSSDNIEYNDYSNKDLRIAKNSTFAGANIGAGTTIPKSGGGTFSYSYFG